MAFDFPNSPTVGQVITGPVGALWSWDGAKWAAGGAAGVTGVTTWNGQSGNVVLTAADVTAVGGLLASGGTMTGNLFLNGDPITSTQAATKNYVDVRDGTRMPISGGTFTGTIATDANSDLIAGRTAYVTNALAINPANSWEWVLYREAATGDHIQSHRAGGWYERWSSADGSRHWAAPSGYIMNLDGSGNMQIAGSFSAPGGIATGANGISTNSLTLPAGWAFYYNGSQHVQQHIGGWAETWDTSGGMRHWTTPSGDVMNLDGGGNVNIAGAFHAGGQIYTGSTLMSGTTVWARSDVGFGLSDDNAGTRYCPQLQSSWAWEWNTTSGDLVWFTNLGQTWFYQASAGQFCFNNITSVGGRGAYVNLSDVRGKQDIQAVDYGLKEVMVLEPKKFRRLRPTGPDTMEAGEDYELGFVADEVLPVLPEIVTKRDFTMPDGSVGGLALYDSMLTAVLWNAVRELSARVAQLEARQ